MTRVSPLPQLPISHPPHTRYGIASSILAVVIAIGVAVLVFVSPERGAVAAPMAVELGAWATLIAAGAGLILGLVGAFQQNCHTIFGFVGIGLNLAAVLVTGSLMAIGAIAY